MKRLEAFAIGLIERVGAGNEQRRMVTIPRCASLLTSGTLDFFKNSQKAFYSIKIFTPSRRSILCDTPAYFCH
jgi:hypothetical protein